MYAKPGMRFVHRIAVNNELHHRKPREFLKKNWWQSSWDLVLASALTLGIAWWFGALTWPVVLFAVLVANANQMHKWTHQSRRENNAVIRFLQKIRVLQTPRHHAKHHTGDKNTHYCVLTNVLNPVLERVSFWRRMERFMATIFPSRRTQAVVAAHASSDRTV